MKQWIWLCLLLGMTVAQSRTAMADDVSQCEQFYLQKQYELALPICKKEAEQKHLKAQVYLGALYQFGLAVKKDNTKAVKWYRKAAEQGLAAAQLNLGIMYSNGHGVSQSYKEATKWYHKAAEQGLAKAQFNLGNIYGNGLGVTQNYKEAMKWWRKAADQGHDVAQFNLGQIYANGQGVTQNDKEAAKWWRKAAKQGLADAQYNLGRYHALEDITEALKWLIMSAKQGHRASEQFIFGMASLGYDGAVGYWNKQHPEQYLVGWGDDNYSYFDSTQIRHTPNGIAIWITHQNRTDPYQKGVESILLKCDEYLTKTLSTTVYMGDNVQTIHPEKIAFDIPRPGSPLSNVMDKVCKSNTPAHKKGKINASISFGTGWPISGSYVVTNNHVIAGHKKFTLLRTDGTGIPATLVMHDGANDLALLKVKDTSKMPRVLRLASMPARIGDKVFTIGYPHPTTMGAKPKLTDGIVSAVTGIKDDPRTYQISVPLQAGNSGGPLLNMDGEVVGIVTAKLSAVKMFKWTGDLPQNVNYAVKSPYLSVLLSTSPKGKKGRTVSIKDDASLADLAESIKNSVMIVVAE